MVMVENSISCSSSSFTIQEFLLPRLLLLVAEELLLLPVAPRCCFLRSNMLAERRFCFRTDTIAKPPINRQITWSRTFACKTWKPYRMHSYTSIRTKLSGDGAPVVVASCAFPPCAPGTVYCCYGSLRAPPPLAGQVWVPAIAWVPAVAG